MSKTLTVMVLVLSLGLFGCTPPPDMPMYNQTSNAKEVTVKDNARATVTRIGVFEDNLAYGSRRGVYLIRDEKTGKEYLGVSGIGISELGSHSAGKVIMRDER